MIHVGNWCWNTSSISYPQQSLNPSYSQIKHAHLFFIDQTYTFGKHAFISHSCVYDHFVPEKNQLGLNHLIFCKKVLNSKNLVPSFFPKDDVWKERERGEMVQKGCAVFHAEQIRKIVHVQLGRVACSFTSLCVWFAF